MELLIPGWMVLAAAGVGAGIGTAVIVFLFIKQAYIDTDRARHSYMAHQLQGVRRRHNDWERVPPSFPGDVPRRPFERAMTWLLDVVYRRGRG